MRDLALLAALALAACATPRALPVSGGFSPVALGEFRQGEVLVLPDAPPAGVFANLGAHLAACPPQGGLVRALPEGYEIVDASGQGLLLVRIARVSESSAVNLTGPALTPALKESLADAALGRSSCAT